MISSSFVKRTACLALGTLLLAAAGVHSGAAQGIPLQVSEAESSLHNQGRQAAAGKQGQGMPRALVRLTAWKALGSAKDVFDSCDAKFKGNWGNRDRNGISLWSSEYNDLCVWGVQVALPENAKQWRLTFSDITSCFGETWALVATNSRWDIRSDGELLPYVSGTCRTGDAYVSPWFKVVDRGRGNFVFVTDELDSPLSIGGYVYIESR